MNFYFWIDREERILCDNGLLQEHRNRKNRSKRLAYYFIYYFSWNLNFSLKVKTFKYKQLAVQYII